MQHDPQLRAAARAAYEEHYLLRSALPFEQAEVKRTPAYVAAVELALEDQASVAEAMLSQQQNEVDLMTRPHEPAASEPYKNLFELMMGITAEEWDALGREVPDLTGETDEQGELSRDELAAKALAALDEVVEQTERGPVSPTLAIRFALAYLYASGAGDRRYYDEFWRTMQNRYDEWGTVHASVTRYNMTSHALMWIAHDIGRQDLLDRCIAAREQRARRAREAAARMADA